MTRKTEINWPIRILISLSSATINNTQPIRGGDYDSLSWGYTDMGKSATTLDIREPPRFIWSLIIRSSQKSPIPIEHWCNPYPLCCLGITIRRKWTIHATPSVASSFLDQPKMWTYSMPLSIGITKSMWTNGTQMHSSKPCVPCPFQPNVDLLQCHSGFSVILATFPEHTCRKRDCPIEEKCGCQLAQVDTPPGVAIPSPLNLST